VSETGDPRLRVLLVSHYFLPGHRAGVENYTYRLAKALGERHDVVVFCREDGFWDLEVHETEDVHAGVSVHRVYYNGRQTFGTGYQNPALDRLFRSFLERWRPDVVHFQHLERLSTGFIDVAAALGIPTVLTLNDYWFACPQIQLFRDGAICPGPDEGRACASCSGALTDALKLQVVASARDRWDTYPLLGLARQIAAHLAPRRLRRATVDALVERRRLESGVSTAATVKRFAELQRAFRAVDLVLSPSRFLLRILRDLGFEHPAAEYSDYGTPEFEVLRSRVPAPYVRFGCFSTLVPHKGTELLIRAFRRLRAPHAQLILQGQGAPPFEEKIRRLSAGDARISFRPPYDEAEVGRAFSRIDVLVVPSLWYENSPILIHEAARAGIPVIAADLGGMAEYVKTDANGLLFRPNDEDDLRRTLQRFVDDPALPAHLQQIPFPLKSIADDADDLARRYAGLRKERHERAAAAEIARP
jgi:glycosyltransferase involved in cell wall biosynthesis